MRRRRFAAGILVSPISAKTFTNDCWREKVAKGVVDQIESGRPARVLIRVIARELQAEVEKATTAIYSNPTTSAHTKKKQNDAAYEAYREKLLTLKSSVLPRQGRPGVSYLGDVQYGPEIIALIESVPALTEIASHPSVEQVFLDGSVELSRP